MADRKAELAAKKKRLEEIRQSKNKEKGTKPPARPGTTSSPSPSRASSTVSSSSTATSSFADVDAIIAGIDLPTAVPAGAVSAAASKKPSDSQSSVASSDSLPTSPVPPRKEVKLSIAVQTQTNIPPKEHVVYSKETQTIEEIKVEPQEKLDLEEPEKNRMSEQSLQTEEEKRKEKDKKDDVLRVELAEDQKQQILASQDFAQFLEHTSRMVEKALCEDDCTYDYGAHDDDTETDTQTSKKLSLNRQFYDDKWSKHRCVTCLDWSTQYPELLVASYNQNEDSPQDPDGVALVWNMKFPKATPEYVFHNQSPIMSVCFSQYHPNLLVGGTYSGQIVLWDNRSRKRTPVQKTPLSAAAHTHPVYSVQVIGTQNAHNLISYSTDGKMCQWSLDMLAQPQDVTELQQHLAAKSVSVTCASFLPGDVNNFVVGSEDGAVYAALRHGSKAGIQKQFEGHAGPVTSINYNAVPGPIDFSHLFLTSSFDWTIKLWSNKEQSALYSFEDNSDYVYDVQWSPVHPALFAAVDGGMGKLDLWNLNNDTEVPTTSVTIDGLAAINRVRWAGNGLQLAAGDDEGHIYIYDVGEQLALPRVDEWTRFVTTLQDLQANTAGVANTGSPEKIPLSPSGLSASFASPPRISNLAI